MWTSGFSVGVAEIDEEHQVLFECLKTARAALDSSLSHAVAFTTLEKLTDYARTLFRVETCPMRPFDDPDLPAHRQEHGGFIEKPHAPRGQVSLGNVWPAVLDFLGTWLLKPIRHIDTRALAFFRTQRGAGLTAPAGIGIAA